LASAIRDNDPDFTATPKNATSAGVGTDGIVNSAVLSLQSVKPMSAKDITNMPGNNENISTTVGNSVKFTNPYTNTTTNKFSADPDALLSESFNIEFSELPKPGDTLKIDGLTITFGQPASNYANGAARIDVTGKDIPTVLNEIVGVLNSAVQDTARNPVAALSPVYSVSGTSLTLGTNKTDDGANNGLDIELKDNDFDVNRGKDLSLQFQIGANSSESLEINLAVMDAANLGIGFNADGTPAVVG